MTGGKRLSTQISNEAGARLILPDFFDSYQLRVLADLTNSSAEAVFAILVDNNICLPAGPIGQQNILSAS